MAGTTRLELATSAVTVTLSDGKQMISWASMAIFSTLEHSKTLGKTRIPIFSTLASTLGNRTDSRLRDVWTFAVHRQQSCTRAEV